MGDTVLHHVELSLFPNWVGVTQERLVKISGDQLTLSTRPLLLQGRQQTAHCCGSAFDASRLAWPNASPPV
jgi:Lipocalin-like domain